MKKIKKINENYNIDNVDQLKDYAIIFHNFLECRDIAIKLTELGFRVFNFDEIINLDKKGTFLEHWKCFRFHITQDYFARSSIVLDPLISYKNFMELDFDKIDGSDILWYNNGEFVKENLNITGIDDLKKYCIVYNNAKECKEIALKLKSFGFDILSYDKIMRIRDTDDLYCYISFFWVDGLNCFARSVSFEGKKPLSYVDFMKINFDKMDDSEILWYDKGNFIKENHDEIGINFLKNCYISYDNQTECRNIAIELKKLGFDVYNYDIILNYYSQQFKGYKYNGNSKQFVRIIKILDDLQVISYEEFMILISVMEDDSDIFWYNNGEFIKENMVINQDILDSIKHYRIFYADANEMKEICSLLLQIGFDVYNKDEIMNKGIAEYVAYSYDRINNIFRRGGSNTVVGYKDVININYDQFLTVLKSNKRIREVVDLEIDPFGEDFWGYEYY